MHTAVEENASLISKIADAGASQTAAIQQVTVAVRNMDEMTQHNASLVEQTNAAIEQTEGQAAPLDDIVETFRVSGSPQAVAEAA